MQLLGRYRVREREGGRGRKVKGEDREGEQEVEGDQEVEGERQR